jgi:hypothetical protein
VLGTVIVDVYAADQAADLAEAIDWLCPPDPTGPFASSGLYAFWDATAASKELLYIGLARDLGIRFRQHNGLAPCGPAGCKVNEVRSYFAESDRLGYTLVPQSPLDQPDSSRARRRYGADLEARAMLEEQAVPGHEEIVHLEGQLLGAHMRRHGRLPPWNTIGGSAFGAARATGDTEPFLDLLRARYKCALNSKLTIRQLALDDAACRWENLLHVARWNLLEWSGEVSDELLLGEIERLAAAEDWTGAAGFRELLESGYLGSGTAS